ncbi:uncharacterized protein LOC135715235 [Ochlerotatus camptorhynchus]|uniref:uncharacterized protein LOC135715235 n=1 Tax=Ochlerotatus camptorhynchus TaxID=644619 RepID=UPI0031DE4A4C
MRLVRVNNIVIVILVLSIVHHAQCRNNDLIESKSEKRRNTGRLRARKSSARIVEKTIKQAEHCCWPWRRFHRVCPYVYNLTDANNNTLSVMKSVAQIDIDEVKSKKIRTIKKGKTLLICPQEKQVPFQLIPTLCRRTRDCKKTGNNSRCCNLFGSKRCVPGVLMPIQEPVHDPIFGIPRRCPEQPLTETFWDIKTCQTDNDCWPRVCCPDGEKKYCRTSQPIFEKSENPAKRNNSNFFTAVGAVSQYLQCTPPPPVIFDIHPKPCNSTLDCFPNLCCQESGKRHCRPPKRSLLAFVTELTSRFNVGALKDIADNLVIRK